ncbi:hypothetical protein POM88_003017 [Heracleum sosnowskyi]|uniref:TF-B3 domain-containing protein n=1 Tax=Heracleum sosnowskyi TaxID=360622 RepID=A0AAD8NBV9_9APIA|nr:hypothetical protein POM88_003017 [Heracleum sosnowskyi]
MDLDECKISMISMISSSDYKRGRLKLPLPFNAEYANDLPAKLKLHVTSGRDWEVDYVPGSIYVEGLKAMMDYYGLRPYHLALLNYVEGGDFDLHFYTPYAVEMQYSINNDVSATEIVCTPVVEDKLCSTYQFNVVKNFLGVYNLLIQNKDLLPASYAKVLSPYVCYKLHLTESVRSITLGYEDHEWRIKLKFVNGEALFSKKWFNFVDASNLLPGDIVAFYKTPTPFKYKVSVFDQKIVSEETLGGDVSPNSSYANFYKVITWDSLEDGELELPRVFRNNYGHTLGDILHIQLGGGYTTQFKYFSATHKIHGLFRFFGKYSIEHEDIIFFNYLGNSTFSVAVYDSQGMNHFRDITGYLRFEDFINPPCDMEIVLVSSDSEDSVTDNAEVVDNEGLFFSVILKKSHVDQHCHGVYIPSFMWPIYRNWGKRTLVRLILGERHWHVEVMRHRRQCRFGIGWDDFTFENNFTIGQRISFNFLGDLTFEKLPLPFYLEYGTQLPKKLFLHVPSNAIWPGELSEDKKHIEGLDEMMSFHNIQPYHIAMLEYLGDGKNFKFRFCPTTHKISGLIYDTFGTDYLREMDGFLRLHEFVNPPRGCQYIDLSNISGSIIEDDDEEVKSAPQVVPFVSEGADVNSNVEMQVQHEVEGVDNNMNAEIHVEQGMEGVDNDMNSEMNIQLEVEGLHHNMVAEMPSFNIILKKSHVHQRSHGVYIPRQLLSVYEDWGRRTLVTLIFRATNWNVEVIRNQRTCRFGIGWDKFISDNRLTAGIELSFDYSANFMFQVRISGP